jgi:putative N6-adenine-specific DNA methylase
LSQELQELWPWLLDLDGRPHGYALGEMRLEPGGLEIEAPLHLGLQLNFVLKTAHRVLLRLASFKVRDFPKLFQRAQKIDWGAWIPADSQSHVALEVAASGSRLNNEKRIIETLSSAWKLKPVPKNQAKDKIFVRMFEDQVTISLDTTGEHLHFRGDSKKIGEAPLRETLAAFCLQRLIADKTFSDLQHVTLIDPMMGSGTFLQEAALLREPLHRPFPFQRWKGIPKALSLDEFQRPWRHDQPLWHKLMGFDLVPEMVSLAQENFKNAGASDTVPVELAALDLFAKAATSVAASPGGLVWCVLNPPYGERIKATHSPKEIMEAMVRRWRPERIGVLWSQAQGQQVSSGELRFPQGAMRKIGAFDLQNGGLQVQFQVWERTES